MELLYFWASQFNWFFNNLPGYDARKMPLGKLSKSTILKVARYQYCGLMPCFDLLLLAELLACTVKLKWNESVPSQACCSLNDGTVTFFTWTVFTHLTRAMRYWRGLLLPWRTQTIQKEMGHCCNWAGTTSKCYLWQSWWVIFNYLWMQSWWYSSILLPNLKIGEVPLPISFHIHRLIPLQVETYKNYNLANREMVGLDELTTVVWVGWMQWVLHNHPPWFRLPEHV